MSTRFRHAALVGKFSSGGIREVLGEIAQFLVGRGLAVSLEARDRAQHRHRCLARARSPRRSAPHCDIAVVLGGDGTMLGIARQLARHGTPLVGINQGRLGFITDIAFDDYEAALAAILDGEYEEEQRAMLEGARLARRRDDLRRPRAQRRGRQPRRHRQHGRAEDRDRRRVRRQPARRRPDRRLADRLDRVRALGRRADPASGHRRLGAGADRAARPLQPADRRCPTPATSRSRSSPAATPASTSTCSRSPACVHGDRIRVRRSAHQARFLHPRGWSYYSTLRRKLHWHRASTEERA